MTLVLLGVAVLGLFVRPRRVPPWVGAVGAAVCGLSTGWIRWADVEESVGLLRDPLLFLVLAVPLAVLLDRLGVFAALAAVVDGGRHLVAWMWVLAAGVTAVLNLDAAVVLLTPLYIRLARRHGLDVEMMAFIPALLACLASSPLPVSNLTNLIVAERDDLGAVDFLRHLALPTVVAVTVGWWAFRRHFGVVPASDPVDEPVDHRALRRGLPILTLLLAGFTVGDVVGVPAWVVAAVALVWTWLLVRRSPLSAVPSGAVLVALGLTVVVAGAVPRLGLGTLLDGHGAIGRATALGVGVAASALTNNLPAVLAGGAALGDRDLVWPLLIGVNVGPVLVVSGALSGLLWRDTASSLGVVVSARRYSAVGVRVGAPALVAAGVLVVVLG